ncbi:unnamed protein product [Blepharisma stoltei]|uniref:Uncharacterized protein n=1 Tax=Blepharisma stoltei TaxID=1481888 RepID=A0AAU9JDY5_9CILI|nr:unnamed protein product [Blepharisma stoltei]
MENSDIGWGQQDYEANKMVEMDRLGFIRKVYGILTAELFVTFLMCLVVFLSEDYQDWIQDNIWCFIIAAIGAIAIILVLFCFKKVCRMVPINYILLFAFSILEGFTLSVFVSYYDPTEVLIAVTLTFGLTFVLTAYAITTKTDFSAKIGYILVISIAVSALAILLIFFSSNIVLWIVCPIIIACYGIFIIYDTQLIVGGKRYQLSSEDYILGSVILYIDIIGLFQYILLLIGGERR